MVFFVCEACNETLKKNQVDKHAMSCRGCYAVTCVDCSVTFHGDDYATHTTCISEAEKYEKSLYKPKASKGKPSAQEIWTSLIEEVPSMSEEAPVAVRSYLDRLSSLGNVPRNKKKFLNFAKNSLKLWNDSVLEQLWDFLDKVRIKRENEGNDSSALNNKTDVDKKALEVKDSSEPKSEEKKTDSTKEVSEVRQEKKEKKDKKDKKDKKKKKDKADSDNIHAQSTLDRVEDKKRSRHSDDDSNNEEGHDKKKSKKSKKAKKDCANEK